MLTFLTSCAFSAGPVGFKDCFRAAPPLENGAQLIIAAADGKNGQLRGVLKSAGLDCVAQLQIDEACLVQFVQPAGETLETTALRLKSNIYSLKDDVASPEIQSVIGEVSVNVRSVSPTNRVASPVGGGMTIDSKQGDPMWKKQEELNWLGAEHSWFDAQESPKPAVTAILDSGVRMEHRDLTKQFLGGVSVNCGSGKCDGTPRRDWLATNVFHGTQVAGIIGAKRGNGIGGIGVAHNTRFISVNYGPVFDDFYLSCAIQFARTNNVRVINASWQGTDERLPRVAKEIDAAAAQGILLVVSSGDDSIDLDADLLYPPSFKSQNLLTVMGFDVSTSKAGASSNFGLKTVHIAAPERSGWTTSLHQTSDKDAEGPTESAGTSWAAAYVSGAAALLESRYPDTGYDFLKWRIMANSTPFHDLEGKSQTGGVLNLAKTLFPVKARGDFVNRTIDSELDWQTGIRHDMCTEVSIEGRVIEGGKPGEYFPLVDSTTNDGTEPIPHARIPAGSEKLIQLKVKCLTAKPTAESEPLPLK